MPERVKIVFDDDGESLPAKSPLVPNERTTIDPTARSKKRKRSQPDTEPSKATSHPEPPISKKVPAHQSNGTSRKDPKFQSPLVNSARAPTGKPKADRRIAHDGPLPPRNLKEKKEALLPFRKDLPIWKESQKIKESLRGSKDVLVLVGETGSGKSTQVPQFLLDEDWCKGCIAITQPRRVAAVSLARRVADEMGTPLGSSSPASKVGYSVRFDTSVSPSTRIKFLTEGRLLQEMLQDPWLKRYSAVIVDEVHERSINVDLILGFLRNLVHGDKSGRKGKPLKVVVMSATADTDKLVSFFSQHSDSLSLKPTISAGRGNSFVSSASTEANGNQKMDVISTVFVQGRQFPVDVIYLPQPAEDFVDAALKCVFQIHHRMSLPGDILVFLTGQDAVESLERLVNEYAKSMDAQLPKILVLPLFAALPQAAQQKVFHPAPYRTRKVIISTNIAETSVTVPGVRYVVDCGKVKVKQFRNRLGLDSLLVKPISKSSATQRKGRAGREAPGNCYRLYQEKDYHELQDDTTPEILRCDLSDAVLGMKARGIDDIINFPFMDPPARQSLETALLQLLQFDALEEKGVITEMGRQMARLPLSPALGRVLVEAAKPHFECVYEVIDIISCLSVENIFLSLVTEEQREAAEEARKTLFRREGDHMTMLATVRGYAAEMTDRRVWSEKHFVSHRAMQNVMDVRKQLIAQCMDEGLLSNSTVPESTQDHWSDAQSEVILRCLLRGFTANTARLLPDGTYRTLVGNQTVAIHPSSVLFGRKLEAILFTEFVFTNKSYGRNVSVVQLKWIQDVLEETT